MMNSSTGLICAWAITIAVQQVGVKCFQGQDIEFQQALKDGVAAYDRYMLVNTDMSADDILRFKSSQGITGVDNVCQSDAASLYRLLRAAGSERLRSEVTANLAKPGPPTWGTCL